MRRTKKYAERDSFDDESDIEAVHDVTLDVWVPKTVEKRLIEAARLVERVSGSWKPKEFGNSMPVFQRDWTDWLAQLDEAGKDLSDVKIERDEGPMRRGATSREISRMEAAICWPVEYLGEQPGPRKVLAVFLRCKAYRKPFDRACKRLGWPRATAYRARDKALSLIAQGLNRDAVPVDL